MRFFKSRKKDAFSIVELGSVTKATQGIFLLVFPDGGDYPFDRVDFG